MVKNQFKGKFSNFFPFSFHPYFSNSLIFVFMFLQANKFMILGCFAKVWRSFDLKTIKLMFSTHGVMKCSWDYVSLILVAIVM
jgi:hypothetical protein